MFGIISSAKMVGTVISMNSGSEWYSASKGWTPASDEATVYETREEAEAVIKAESLGRSAGVIEIDQDDTMPFRSDGLNNPLSPNSGIGCTWDAVESMCEEADHVISYDRTGSKIEITYCDDSVGIYTDPQAAMCGINQSAE